MFSGIGGFEYGIHNIIQQRQEERERNNLSFKRGECIQHPERPDREPAPVCIGFSEIDKYAIQIYRGHFPNHKGYGDVKKINWKTVEDFDFLVAGFPCQAFSTAGRQQGFRDTRGTLFFEIARCLREKQPRLFLLENVKGLLSHDKGYTFLTIITTLDGLGYDLQWQVLNTKDFGIPQNRERVFIVGHLRGTGRPEIFPIGGNDKKSSREVCPTIRATHHKSGDNQPVIREGPRIRRLTPIECERLQGFPDGWTEGVSDTQRYKCLGNAVTTNVVSSIFMQIINECKIKH